ncbi:MAG: fused MFS/spermidine synthase [Gemmatimonadota bacterium]
MKSPSLGNSSPAGGTKSEPERPFLPVLLLLFVGSGCAALIYEIVWFQMLQLVIGASGISLGVLLGTFMGGMFLGSLFLPRFVPPTRHPLLVYAAMEAGIGVLGLILLVAVPGVSGFYGALVPPGLPSIFMRTFLCVLLLLPPTILMGATLPAMARYVEATPRGVSWMGFFYGGNIAGAVLGCLLAGYYLLRLFDLQTATGVAVGLNVLVAAVAVVVSRVSPHRPRMEKGAEEKPLFTAGRTAVYVGIALSGLTALGAEVVWTRLLSLLLGATTYTFSIILAVFLAALGVGSVAGSYLARTLPNPRAALGICQAMVVLGLAWTAYLISSALPYWPINPSITSSPWFLFQIDMTRAVIALLPAPLLWGASFPLAVAAAAKKGQDSGRLMAGTYAANTVGAILGALGFSLIAIPWLGTQNAQRLLMLLTMVSAAILLAPGLVAAKPAQKPTPEPSLKGASRAQQGERAPAAAGGGLGRWASAGVSLAMVAYLVSHLSPVPPVLVAYGRYAPTYHPPLARYVGEGINSSIAVTEMANGDLNIHVGGKIVASTEPQDMRLQRLLGHITALLAQEPRSVLVVGFGAGVTAGTFVTHPSIERIVIVEIEPLVTDVASEFFSDFNYDVLKDPRVELIHDDGRHFLLTTDETFDLITADPIHPWMKGAAALYTQEYFELAARHLKPGGVLTQWVPLYETTAGVVKSEMATFFQVFPQGMVWGNTKQGLGYDLVLAATDGTPRIDIDGLTARLNRVDHARVRQSLGEVGYSSALELLSTYAGRARELEPWLEGSQINRDRNLRLMYLAGLQLNKYQQSSIYREILGRSRFPAEIFAGSPQSLALLRMFLEFE